MMTMYEWAKNEVETAKKYNTDTYYEMCLNILQKLTMSLLK